MHINKINNKKYIGITGRKNPKWRWGGKGQKYNDTPYFWNAIQKYGWENFEHKILLTGLTEEEAKQKEKELIKKYKTTNRKLGYNISAGGGDMSHLNRIHSPEEIAKATQRLLNYMATHENPWKGKHHSLEYKKRKSEMECKRLAENVPNRLGAHLDENSKNKISEGRLKKGLTYRVKCIETGKEYISARKAVEDLGRSSSSGIIKCCKGEAETSFGYHWKIIGDLNNINIPKSAGKKRKVVCLETNKIYDSLAAAGRDIGVDKNSIWRCCQESYKMSKGYHFKYYNEESNAK